MRCIAPELRFDFVLAGTLAIQSEMFSDKSEKNATLAGEYYAGAVFAGSLVFQYSTTTLLTR